MKNIAFIPLRGGSTSIPLKNIRSLNGRPLAYYTIDAAVNCKDIDTVVIATDYDEIKNVIEQYSSDKILVVGRSEAVSTNTAPTIDVVLEFTEKYDFETMVLIQATSPLLTTKDIDGGLKVLQEGYDSCLSVVRHHVFVWDEKTKQPNFTIPYKPRRQDWNGILIENGAFYINSRDNILKDKFYLSGNIGLYEMPYESHIELDEEIHWQYIEFLLKNRNS